MGWAQALEEPGEEAFQGRAAPHLPPAHPAASLAACSFVRWEGRGWGRVHAGPGAFSFWRSRSPSCQSPGASGICTPHQNDTPSLAGGAGLLVSARLAQSLSVWQVLCTGFLGPGPLLGRGVL